MSIRKQLRLSNEKETVLFPSPIPPIFRKCNKKCRTDRRLTMAITSMHMIQTAFLAAIFLFRPSLARTHIVGGSVWSIPLAADFYSNWAHNTSFEVGDTLVFRFEMGLYDVVEVSQSEFERCKAEKPFRTFLVGPAELHLDEGGLRYFICSVGNYCFLGMKLPVSVQSLRPPPAGSSSPIPSAVP